MRLQIGLLTLLYSFSSFSTICICQFPDENSRHGQGRKGEIAFYKLGCSYWIKSQKDCRESKVKNINDSLSEYLDKRILPNDLVKIGYVGHWSESYSTIRYLEQEIKPILDRYRVSIEVDNTACDPLKNPNLVFNHIKKYILQIGTYLRIQGAQTTSIGMWDKLSAKFKYADLLAHADTRDTVPGFPKCSTYINERCTKHQHKEYGYCTNNESLKKIYCKKKTQSSKQKYWLF